MRLSFSSLERFGFDWKYWSKLNCWFDVFGVPNWFILGWNVCGILNGLFGIGWVVCCGKPNGLFGISWVGWVVVCGKPNGLFTVGWVFGCGILNVVFWIGWFDCGKLNKLFWGVVGKLNVVFWPVCACWNKLFWTGVVVLKLFKEFGVIWVFWG